MIAVEQALLTGLAAGSVHGLVVGSVFVGVLTVVGATPVATVLAPAAALGMVAALATRLADYLAGCRPRLALLADDSGYGRDGAGLPAVAQTVAGASTGG